MTEEIYTVTIDNETGESVIDVVGSDGKRCMETTKALEQVLTGGIKRLLSRKLKSEALNRVVKQAKQAIGQG